MAKNFDYKELAEELHTKSQGDMEEFLELCIGMDLITACAMFRHAFGLSDDDPPFYLADQLAYAWFKHYGYTN